MVFTVTKDDKVFKDALAINKRGYVIGRSLVILFLWVDWMLIRFLLRP